MTLVAATPGSLGTPVLTFDILRQKINRIWSPHRALTATQGTVAQLSFAYLRSDGVGGTRSCAVERPLAAAIIDLNRVHILL